MEGVPGDRAKVTSFYLYTLIKTFDMLENSQPQIRALVHMLSSKRGNLLFLGNTLVSFDKHHQSDTRYDYKSLYFTTDEQIKEGDWVITQTGYLRQCTKTRPQGDKYICLSKDNLVLTSYCRKVVATTDPDLWCTGISREGSSCSKNNNCTFPLCNIAKIHTAFVVAYVREQGNIKEVALECNQLCHQTGQKCGFPCNGEDNCKKSLYLKFKENGTVIVHRVKPINPVIEILENFCRMCEDSAIYDKLDKYGDPYYKAKKWLKENK